MTSNIKKRQSAAGFRGKSFRTWLKDSTGSTVMMVGVSLPVLIGVIGAGVDIGVLNIKKQSLQLAADQAALAAAQEFSMASSSNTSVQEAAATYVKTAIKDERITLEVTTEIDRSKNSVTVNISEVWVPFFAHFLSSDITPINANATAALVGETKLCVLALSPDGVGAVSMTKSAHMQADGCTIYSNSNNASSVYMGDISSISAKLVCTVGGVKDNGGVDADKIVTDCPVLKDPLAERAPPPVGMCDFTNIKYIAGSVTLTPGVYCGGIALSGTAKATLEKGVYIIKDGPLLVRDKAELHGKNVGFYTTGKLGMMHFLQDATIDLSGRQEGAMAGMLFFDDPAGATLRIHSISARNAHTLTGTIYLPHGNLIVDPIAMVGSKSAYTAIVAQRLVVQNGPTLVLNSNYDATPVPVPEGIRAAADIHLID